MWGPGGTFRFPVPKAKRSRGLFSVATSTLFERDALMPRFSTDALLTVSDPSGKTLKLEALDGMTEREGEVWRAVVDAMQSLGFGRCL